MKHFSRSLKNFSLVALTVALPASSISPAIAQTPSPSGPAKVEVRHHDDRFQLFVNGQPFYIKGAGIELGSPEELRKSGGNSFRTWSTQNGRDTGKQVLDRALTNGLYVAMGLDVDHERRGFDYDDTNAVARQFELLKSQVLQYRNHPALLLWVVGNELNFEKNPKVWDAVNDLSKMIHELDPNHPTTTPLAGFQPETVKRVRSRAADLDFISFQMYSDIANLPKYLRAAAWDKPYIVTEWGATGHWECGKTAWGAPLENDSTTKADLYQKRFRTVIESDQKLCLGSYVFLWGNKQERTPTWYGMFLNSGEETAPVDVMRFVWTGSWPANRSPRLEGAWLDGKTAAQSVRLRSGQTYTARVAATDPDGDALTFRWEVMEESTETKIGGDAESQPAKVPNAIANPSSKEISLQAPEKAGAYRVFAYVFDGQGHAAHVNIPFYVEDSIPNQQAAATISKP
ncbi:MAG: glycoside hydrolase family 2 TIM barrel-domain containing protein [Verrucomicrobiota bacterium]